MRFLSRAPSTINSLVFPAQTVRQLRGVGRNPPRLVGIRYYAELMLGTLLCDLSRLIRPPIGPARSTLPAPRRRDRRR